MTFLYALVIVLLLGAMVSNVFVVYEWTQYLPVGNSDLWGVFGLIAQIIIAGILVVFITDYLLLVVCATIGYWLFNYYARYRIRYHRAQQMY